MSPDRELTPNDACTGDCAGCVFACKSEDGEAMVQDE